MSLNITTKQIKGKIQEYVKRDNELQRRNPAVFDRLFEINRTSLRQREQKYLRPTCPDNYISGFQLEAGKIDVAAIHRVSVDELYNPRALKALGCTVDSYFYTVPGNIAFSTEERIREWVTNLKQIGAESAFGIALSADVKDVSNPRRDIDNVFVIKTVRDRTEDDLFHEYFIGYFLNELREIIPNFVKTFAQFKCPPVALDKNRKVVSLCDRNATGGRSGKFDDVNFLVIENLAPSITLYKYLETATIEQFAQMFFQVIWALREAQRLFQFAHNDLHAENVLVRRLADKEFYIPYTIEGQEYLLLTDGVATIIDFGRSRITVEGKDYGADGLELYGIFNKDRSPFADVYRFLLFCSAVSYNSNKKLLPLCGQLYWFFNSTESIDSVLITQGGTNYFLPPVPQTEGLTIDDYVRYLLSNKIFPRAMLIPTRLARPDVTILSCQDNDCSSWQESVVTNKKGVDDFFTFYDRYRASKSVERQRAIRNSFNYPQASRNMEITLKDLTSELTKALSNARRVSIKGLELRNLLDSQVLNNIRDMYITGAKIIDLRDKIIFQLQLARNVATIMEREVTKINGWTAAQTSLPRAEIIIKILREQKDLNNAIIDDALKNPRFLRQLRRREDLKWYEVGRSVFK